MFWTSPLFWIAFAVFLFWALGAYNRLMRLRSAVVQAFGHFDAHMVRLVAFLGEFGAAQAVWRASLVATDPNEGAVEAAALQGATNQLSASLAVARARPMDPAGISALSAARDVLQATWLSAARPLQAPSMPNESGPDSAPDTGAAASPSVWQARWDEHTLQNDQAVQTFNDAVRLYNAGIAQFPANLLATIFGFSAALVL